MNELQWDQMLKIRTGGRDDSHSDIYHYPYEPTPYPVLVRLANTGYITKKNTVLDYGSGKGRVSFFLSWQTRCRSLGLEIDERLFRAALANQARSVSGSKTCFYLTGAESFDVGGDVDRFFFFNPFSIEILQSVTGKIRASWYEFPREILLFFYYPSDEYISHLMTADEMVFFDEIDCRDLFSENDRRERILIFRMEG